MAEDSSFDPIPTDIAEVLAFFAESLADVRFPDVDGDALRGLAEDVRARAAEVERLEAQVRTAREAMELAQGELRRAAQRGLAYARVYVDGDPVLSERVEDLALDRAPAEGKSAARQRNGGRKRKAKEGEGARSAKTRPIAELPFAGDGKDPATDAA